jgi:hypothetical protein
VEICWRICESSAWLGLNLDAEANAHKGPRISGPGRRVSGMGDPDQRGTYEEPLGRAITPGTLQKGNPMKIKAILLLFPLFLAAPLWGRKSIDVIVMKNGDHLTCEIKKLQEGVLYTSLDYVDGTISVDWSKVARVESSQLFLVRTQAGTVYTGAIKTPETPADQPVKIEIVEPEQERVLPKSGVVRMDQIGQSFWQRFSVSINSGTIFTKANNNTQYNFGSRVTYRRPRWSAEANFTSALSKTDTATTSTRNQLSLGGERLLRWDNWFYSGVASFLQSTEQGIQLQSLFGGGFGRYIKNTDRMRFSVLGGLALQATNYKASILQQGLENVLSGFIVGDLRVFVFKKHTLNAKASLLPALSQPGRVHFNTDATYAIQIIRNLWWNFQFYGNWDNRPPPTFSGSDYGASSGITWTFN